MRQLICEICDGIDVIKQEGVFVCQTCKAKYSVAEARKMMRGEIQNEQTTTSAEAVLNFIEKAQKMINAEGVTSEQNVTSAEEMFQLGNALNFAKDASKDPAQAAVWYEKAANQGHASAQYVLGIMYGAGRGVSQDNVKAAEWIQKAAEHGHADAQSSLASNYFRAQDYAGAAKWWHLAAEQGHADSQYRLALCYYNGEGVLQDYAKAAERYRLAAEQGHVDAQNNLGLMYTNGEGVPQDDAKAVEWYRLAAEQGHVYSQSNLALKYLKGEGVPQDNVKASEWYRLAAEQGHAEAQHWLGLLYGNGRGVPQDNAEAVKWLQKAAEQGHASAQEWLNKLQNKKSEQCRNCGSSDLYNKERTLCKICWHKEAANAGDAEAQFQLAMCYANGAGVEKDRTQFATWVKKAADQGYKQAQDTVSEIAKRGICLYCGGALKGLFSKKCTSCGR